MKEDRRNEEGRIINEGGVEGGLLLKERKEERRNEGKKKEQKRETDCDSDIGKFEGDERQKSRRKRIKQ